MVAGEPRLRDLPIHDGYRIVPPDLTLPEAAGMFAESPDDALLVHDREEEQFLGVVYLHDLHRAYSARNKELKAPHKAIVSAIMNPGIATIEWGANVTQAIAKARLQTPHGILVRDERGRFAGFLSTTDLNVERERMDRLAAQHRRT